MTAKGPHWGLLRARPHSHLAPPPNPENMHKNPLQTLSIIEYNIINIYLDYIVLMCYTKDR